MFALCTKPKIRSIQVAPFHSSGHVERYGKQNRDKVAKKNFFRPGWRYLLNLENMYTHDIDANPSFGTLLPRTLLFNWPLGDMYIKNRKELSSGHSKWKAQYEKLFPDDKMTFLHRSKPGDIEWYKLPMERFMDRMAVHVTNGMSGKQAFACALQEKRWEEEAKQIEISVQKQQLEILFGVPESNWLSDVTKGDLNDEQEDCDPRLDEVEARDREERILNLIHQRSENPSRRKIKLADVKMRFEDLMDWLRNYPEYKDHFDESIYWGDIPLHTIPKSLPAEMRAKGLPAKHTENTLLEDLDFQMSDWAKDMLSLYWDKVDLNNPELDEETREQLGKDGMAAAMARDEIQNDMGPWAEARLRAQWESDPGVIPSPNTVFSDGAHEVLSHNITEKPFISTKLEEELTNLFKDVNKK